MSFDASSARGDLILTRITKEYGDFKAVDDLSLTIPKGSFFALLGPSGCGKTTTLRMIAGLEEPTIGSIHLGETDITTTKPYQRPINTVFQNYALFPHLTIFENIAFGLRRRGIKDVDAEVNKVLNLVELPHLAGRKPTQLSGGQQQRIALARAIVNRPALLLLDEPLGALDLKLRRQMQIELKWIQKEVGLTFVHVTHDQEEAMTMADTIAVMNEGKIEQMGSPADLYDNPETAFVANFLGQSNLIKGTITGKEPVLVRVHSECLTGDVFGSRRCDCGPQLDTAMQLIDEAGAGVIVYLRGHEGRGIGIGHKIRAYSLQDEGFDTVDANTELGLPVDSREYGIGAQILADLGVRELKLMTNNPAKYGGLGGYGLTVVERVSLNTIPTPENEAYLRTKRERMGHHIDMHDGQGEGK